jgi:sec-independent protein translocase protein TatA
LGTQDTSRAGVRANHAAELSVAEIGPPELGLLLVVAILILGPSRLPDVGGAIGSGVRQFRKAIREEDAEARMMTRAKALRHPTRPRNLPSGRKLNGFPMDTPNPKVATPVDPSFDPVVLAGTLFGYAALWRAGFDANHRFLVLLVATVMGRAAVWLISRRDHKP